jgi:hypothetical protein
MRWLWSQYRDLLATQTRVILGQVRSFEYIYNESQSLVWQEYEVRTTSVHYRTLPSGTVPAAAELWRLRVLCSLKRNRNGKGRRLV